VFYPEMKAKALSDLLGGGVFYLVTALVLGALGRGLKLTEPHELSIEHRELVMAIPLVLLSGFTYVVYYYVFGGITFHFFTKQYYPHAAEQAAALGLWFWGYQWARGLLMTLAVLPISYTLRLRRWQAALAVGAVIWIVGGAAGLLVPSEMMVAAQRYKHIVEIMTQNVSLGVTAVYLLRPRQGEGKSAQAA
jgi:hypothetical protein